MSSANEKLKALSESGKNIVVECPRRVVLTTTIEVPGIQGRPGKDGKDGKDGEKGEPGSAYVIPISNSIIDNLF